MLDNFHSDAMYANPREFEATTDATIASDRHGADNVLDLDPAEPLGFYFKTSNPGHLEIDTNSAGRELRLAIVHCPKSEAQHGNLEFYWQDQSFADGLVASKKIPADSIVSRDVDDATVQLEIVYGYN